MPRIPKKSGGSKASDAVLSGLSCNSMSGGASCGVDANPNLLNSYIGMTPSTVPLGMASIAPGGLDYSSVPASTQTVMNAELTSFGVLPNIFAATPRPFTPPLLVGGAKWHCKFCKMMAEQEKQKRTRKHSTSKKTK